VNLFSFLGVQLFGGALISVAASLGVVFLVSGHGAALPQTLAGLFAELTGQVYFPHVAGGGSLGSLLFAGWWRQAAETLFLTLTLSVASLVWMAGSTAGRGRRTRFALTVLFWVPGPLLLWWLLLVPYPPMPLVVLTLLWTACGGALLPETGQALIRQAAPERTGPAFQLVLSTGRRSGTGFPMPGTASGWLLAATAYRVFPEILSRVPTLVGFALALEVIQNQPGLGTLALQALVAGDTILLAGSVIGIQLLVRSAAFPVQIVLFALYPRRRWSLT